MLSRDDSPPGSAQSVSSWGGGSARRVGRWINGTFTERALGFTATVLRDSFRLDKLHAVVANVEPGGAAANMGVLPGDHIIKINGQPIDLRGSQAMVNVHIENLARPLALCFERVTAAEREQPSPEQRAAQASSKPPPDDADPLGFQIMTASNWIRRIVSKKKRRFQEDGFDLDLSYLTPTMIAMGYPSTGKEALYRNRATEVKRFLAKRHWARFWVFNLCSERDYPPSLFDNRVSRYPFDDHNPPKLFTIALFCAEASRWLQAHEENVIVVHCKAGKGRTGVMACCYLLWAGEFDNARDAIDFFGVARASDGNGITIPSQKRFVYYFGRLLEDHRKTVGSWHPPRNGLRSQVKSDTAATALLRHEAARAHSQDRPSPDHTRTFSAHSVGSSSLEGGAEEAKYSGEEELDLSEESTWDDPSTPVSSSAGRGRSNSTSSSGAWSGSGGDAGGRGGDSPAPSLSASSQSFTRSYRQQLAGEQPLPRSVLDEQFRNLLASARRACLTAASIPPPRLAIGDCDLQFPPQRAVALTGIELSAVPACTSGGWFTPAFKVMTCGASPGDTFVYRSNEFVSVGSFRREPSGTPKPLHFPTPHLPVVNEVLVRFFHTTTVAGIGKKRVLFQVWVHASFLSPSGREVIPLSGLDMAAKKDGRLVPSNFTVELRYEPCV